jgi:hypothetical protein
VGLPGDRRRRKFAKAICRDLPAIAEVGGKIVVATPDIVVSMPDGY